jgi:D-glycero-alpha-D-manno-heptose-7-phosphate kinase
MGMPVGKQDQYAAAFGGLNVISFECDDSVTIEPILLAPELMDRFQRNILLFYTGHARDSAKILKHQQEASAKDSPEVIERLHVIKALALEIRDALLNGELDVVGELMHRSWMQKRGLVKDISNSQIDEWYSVARGAGAIGGKITGAGGGGFLMLYCPQDAQATLTQALTERGLRRMDFAFDFSGVRAISTQAAPALA